MYQIFNKLLNNNQPQYNKQPQSAVKLSNVVKVQPLSEKELKVIAGGLPKGGW